MQYSPHCITYVGFVYIYLGNTTFPAHSKINPVCKSYQFFICVCTRYRKNQRVYCIIVVRTWFRLVCRLSYYKLFSSCNFSFLGSSFQVLRVKSTTSLLILRDPASSHNWPYIASDRLVLRNVLRNWYRYGNFFMAAL